MKSGDPLEPGTILVFSPPYNMYKMFSRNTDFEGLEWLFVAAHENRTLLDRKIESRYVLILGFELKVWSTQRYNYVVYVDNLICSLSDADFSFFEVLTDHGPVPCFQPDRWSKICQE